jgi:general secretion pathway protein I
VIAPQRAGFTLLEVLVALAILAIALSAAVRASAVAIDSANEVKTRTLATWVAQNRMAELAAVASLPGIGETSGRAVMANIEFDWKQRVSATPNAAFRKVEVEVAPAGVTHTLAGLTGYLVRQTTAVQP